VRLWVLADEFLVEIYGRESHAVISDLIFPQNTSDGLPLATVGGRVVLQSVEVRAVSP